MEFNHIHSSSRFSRSARTLEIATDTFYRRASIVTFTEVGGGGRKRAPYENGWGYFNSSYGASGYDECGIAWDLDYWQVKWKRAIKTSGRWRKPRGKGTRWPIVAATVFLKHKQSGHTLLVSVTHMPNKIGGPDGFKPQLSGWAQRVETYKNSTRNWSREVNELKRRHKPDIILISSDWNLNFRLKWVRVWVNGQFNEIPAKHAWKHFTGKGTFGRSVIDAVLYYGCTTSHGSKVIHDPADSSDHTPFITRFSRTAKPGKPGPSGGGGGDGNQTGGGKQGKPWWNFEDYGDDTVYKVEEA